MSKRLLSCLAAVMELYAAQPAFASPASDNVATLAGGMQGLVGKSFYGGVTITQVHSDGEVLVFVVDGPANWRTVIAPDQIGMIFAGDLCEAAADIFSDGKKFRVDTTEDEGKQPMAGPIITTCPAN